MHYVDEGPAEGPVVVLLHGEPSWSYLYRKMISRISDEGFRVIAPDMIGFGKSDKLTNIDDYTYERQVAWMKTLLIDSLALTNIHMFAQDWGGLIGLRVLAENSQYFEKVAVANTALPTGDSIFTVGENFSRWQDFAANSPNFNIGQFIQRGTFRNLSEAEVAAYNAPFPTETHKVGARTMPQLVPTTPNDPASEANRRAWQALSELEIPFLTLYSDLNTVGQEFEQYFQQIIPGAANQPHRLLRNGEHFLQEDNGEELSQILSCFFSDLGQDCFRGEIVFNDPLIEYAASFQAMPKDAASLIPFIDVSQGITFGSGTPYNDIEYTMFDTDYMEGETAGFDLFYPVDPNEASPGSNTVKLLNGVNNLDLNSNYTGPAGDRYILGIASQSKPFFTKGLDDVDNDFAVITNFDYSHGWIQLQGSLEDYELVYCMQEDGCATEGYYLFYMDGQEPDLICFIYPCWDIASTISGNPPRNPLGLCNADSTLSLTNEQHFRIARNIIAQPSYPEGVVQFGGMGKENVGGITTDSEGNMYVFGATDSQFDEERAVEHASFVSKFDENGVLVWNSQLEVSNGTLIFDAVTDENFLYAAGRTLGAIPGFQNAGRWDGIILKLDLDDGRVVVSDQFGTRNLDGYGNIILDDAGNLFVSGAGSVSDSVDTDGDHLLAKHRADNLQNVWRKVEAPQAQPVFVSEAWGGISYVPGSERGKGKLIIGGWYMSFGGAEGFVSIYEDLDKSVPLRTATTTIASPGVQADWVLDNAVDEEGNIYVVGYTTGGLSLVAQGQGDAYIVKYDHNLENPEFMQLGSDKADMFRKIDIDDEGNIFAIGYTYGEFSSTNKDRNEETGDVIIQKFTPDLQAVESIQFGTSYEDRGMLHVKDDKVYVAGITEGSMVNANIGAFDAYVMTLSTSDLSIIPALATSNEPLLHEDQWKVYPNPIQDDQHTLFVDYQNSSPLTYQLFDYLGREIKKGEVDRTTHSISLQEVPAGIYWLKLKSKNKTQSFKIFRLFS